MKRTEKEDEREDDGQSQDKPTIHLVNARRLFDSSKERCWMTVEDERSNTMFTANYFVPSNEASIRLEFTSPTNSGAHKLSVYVMANSYFDCYQEDPFEKKVGVLPNLETWRRSRAATSRRVARTATTRATSGLCPMTASLLPLVITARAASPLRTRTAVVSAGAVAVVYNSLSKQLNVNSNLKLVTCRTWSASLLCDRVYKTLNCNSLVEVTNANDDRKKQKRNDKNTNMTKKLN